MKKIELFPKTFKFQELLFTNNRYYNLLLIEKKSIFKSLMEKKHILNNQPKYFLLNIQNQPEFKENMFLDKISTNNIQFNPN